MKFIKVRHHRPFEPVTQSGRVCATKRLQPLKGTEPFRCEDMRRAEVAGSRFA